MHVWKYLEHIVSTQEHHGSLIQNYWLHPAWNQRKLHAQNLPVCKAACKVVVAKESDCSFEKCLGIHLSLAPLTAFRSAPEPHHLSWSTAPPVESTRVFGGYALPIAAPDMVGDREKVKSYSFDLGLLRQQSLSFDQTALSQQQSWRDWRRSTIGRGFQIVLVLVAAKSLLSVRALRGATATDGQILVVLQGLVSLLSGLVLTACCEVPLQGRE
eukprot:s168_g6.t1